MNNKKRLIIGLVAVAVLVFYFYSPPNSNGEKLEICPDEWIVNKMPMIAPEPGEAREPREYYILNGERREVNEFNASWVKENCDLSPQEVF